MFFQNGVRTLNIKVESPQTTSSSLFSNNYQDIYESYSQSSQPTCETNPEYNPLLGYNAFYNNQSQQFQDQQFQYQYECNFQQEQQLQQQEQQEQLYSVVSANPIVEPTPKSSSDQLDSSDSQSIDNKKKRHKERKISEVIDLVYKWRTLYNGFKHQETGQIHKYSLDEAAKIVGACKKSLNDYFLVIKQAKRLGFCFENTQNEGFGVMRTFVKKAKSTDSSNGSNSPSGVYTDAQTPSIKVSKCKKSKVIKKVVAKFWVWLYLFSLSLSLQRVLSVEGFISQ